VNRMNIVEARFIDRPNRFLGRVELNGTLVEAFIPNPGRMNELMIPGKRVYLRENAAVHRKTSYDMIAVDHEGLLISIDSNLPNKFMKRILSNKRLPMFKDYDHIKSEPPMYQGRFDFLLTGENSSIVIEIKSCTLVENNRAIFPDAPTIRGARHMKHLASALKDGVVNRAAVIFVIQRPDANVFSPNDPTDPQFGDNLREARKAGVEVIPILTELKDWDLKFLKILPYDLDYFLTSN